MHEAKNEAKKALYYYYYYSISNLKKSNIQTQKGEIQNDQTTDRTAAMSPYRLRDLDHFPKGMSMITSPSLTKKKMLLSVVG